MTAPMAAGSEGVVNAHDGQLRSRLGACSCGRPLPTTERAPTAAADATISCAPTDRDGDGFVRASGR